MLLHAQVRNGRLVLDEPTDLPEGEVVALEAVEEEAEEVYVHDGRPFVPRNAEEERAWVLAAYERSRAEFAAGLGRDASEVIRELRAKRAHAK